MFDISKFDGPWREKENHIVITYFGASCGGYGSWSHCRGEPIPAELAGHLWYVDCIFFLSLVYIFLLFTVCFYFNDLFNSRVSNCPFSSKEAWENFMDDLANSDWVIRYILCIIIPLSMFLLTAWIFLINQVDLDSSLFLLYLLIPVGIVLLMSLVQCTLFNSFRETLETIIDKYSPAFAEFGATIKFDIVSVGPNKRKRRIHFIAIDLPASANRSREMMKVTIPSKVSPGERVIVMSPDNQQVTYGIPLNSKAGDVVSVPLPPPVSEDIELGEMKESEEVHRRVSHVRVGYRPKAGIVGRYVNRRESINFKILQPMDTTGDGKMDSVGVDRTGDGLIDTVLKGMPIDINGDGKADAIAVDTNGDGIANEMVPLKKYNNNLV